MNARELHDTRSAYRGLPGKPQGQIHIHRVDLLVADIGVGVRNSAVHQHIKLRRVGEERLIGHDRLESGRGRRRPAGQPYQLVFHAKPARYLTCNKSSCAADYNDCHCRPQGRELYRSAGENRPASSEL